MVARAHLPFRMSCLVKHTELTVQPRLSGVAEKDPDSLPLKWDNSQICVLPHFPEFPRGVGLRLLTVVFLFLF